MAHSPDGEPAPRATANPHPPHSSPSSPSHRPTTDTDTDTDTDHDHDHDHDHDTGTSVSGESSDSPRGSARTVLPRNFEHAPLHAILVLVGKPLLLHPPFSTRLMRPAAFPTAADMLQRLTSINDQIAVQQPNLTRFHSRTPPSITIRDYLARIVQYTKPERSCLLLTLHYVDLICARNPSFALSSLTVHRFLIASITCSSKALCDVFCKNTHYARVGGLGLDELNLLEREFLGAIDWRLATTRELIQSYYDSLVLAHPAYALAPLPTPTSTRSSASSASSDGGELEDPPPTAGAGAGAGAGEDSSSASDKSMRSARSVRGHLHLHPRAGAQRAPPPPPQADGQANPNPAPQQQASHAPSRHHPHHPPQHHPPQHHPPQHQQHQQHEQHQQPGQPEPGQPRPAG
ncbi:cyclin-domain-containing protein [Calocera cornea HHB12733]|uniref:Cyclin-domain-containing protein n=1 Tax=Calocera cornea HHB12733 TaxID=1353952 RepID=A0A165HNN3_9BASI|nr:cyclin-domain-containing protein [Calocera cornea HHB12733]